MQICPVSRVSPINVRLTHTLYVKMQYYISLQSTSRRPKLQYNYEIQHQSNVVMMQLRLEQVIVVMDQAMHAKAI